MNLYLCKRFKGDGWDGETSSAWMGAMLITANTEKEATKIFGEEEDYKQGTKHLEEIEFIEGCVFSGEPRLIWNDVDR